MCISDIPEAMAIMKSPPAGPPAMPCSVTLWYYCKDTIPSLSLSAWTAGTVNEIISSKDLRCSGNQEWRQTQLYVGEQSYRISVRVKRYDNNDYGKMINGNENKSEKLKVIDRGNHMNPSRYDLDLRKEKKTIVFHGNYDLKDVFHDDTI